MSIPRILHVPWRSALPAQRGFDVLIPPAKHADLVLDGDNALGPA